MSRAQNSNTNPGDPEGSEGPGNRPGHRNSRIGFRDELGAGVDDLQTAKDRNVPAGAPSGERRSSASSDIAYVTDQDADMSVALTFNPESVPLTPACWQQSVIESKVRHTLPEFQEIVDELVVNNLRRDVALKSLLVRDSKLLVFELEVQTSICNEETVNPATSEHAPYLLSGFLTGPEADWALDVTVHLTLSGRVESNPNQLKHRYETIEASELELADLAFEHHWLDHETDRVLYTYVRLGLARETSTRQSKKHQKRIKSKKAPATGDSQPLPQRERIQRKDTLLGYYHGDDLDHLQLVTVSAWDFGKHWIGDCDEHFEVHEFSSKDDYLPQFAGVRSLAGLHTRVKAHLAARNGKVEKGIPFQPHFDLRRFDPDGHDSKTGAPGEFADAVFRFVNHLDLNYQGEDSGQLMPFDVQYSIDAKEGAQQIIEHLVQDLRDRSVSESDDVGPLERTALSRLFDEPLEGRWKVELWVLPQGYLNLMRFPIGRVDQRDSLDQFLSRQMVGSGKKHARALYVEAHIVGLGEEEEDVVFEGIEEDEGGQDGDEVGEDDGDATGGGGKKQRKENDKDKGKQKTNEAQGATEQEKEGQAAERGRFSASGRWPKQRQGRTLPEQEEGTGNSEERSRRP